MKNNLRIACILLLIAGLGIGVVVALPYLQSDDDKPKTIKAKPEPLAALPKEEPKKVVVIAKKEPTKSPSKEKKPIEKVVEPEPKEIKADPEPKKKVEPKKVDDGRPKIIRLGDDLIKLNDPDGEYTVKFLSQGKELKLIGTIKTLTITGLNDRAVLDTADLVADETIFLGNINNGSKAILGKTKTLKIRFINDQSLLDASSAEASAIFLDGVVNNGSTVKLQASKGSVEILGEINDRAQIDIAAPDGKVVFKSKSESVINGDAKVTILSKDVDFAGTINGKQTEVKVTLTKGGSLKFRRLTGGVRLLYSKANASDPEPRMEMGLIDARAQFRMNK